MLSTTFEASFSQSRTNCGGGSAIEALKERLKDNPEELERRLKALEALEVAEGQVQPREKTTRYAPYEIAGSPERFHNHLVFNQLWTIYDCFDRHGTLPFPGSLMQQPAKVMDVFTVLRNLKSSYDLEQMKKQQKEQNKRVRRNGK
ncbi:MAG: hypothetical protein ACOH5I_21880 [Oligoflexus sp.]